MAGPLRPNPPPPSSLIAVEILKRWKKRFQKVPKVPKGSLMARPFREELKEARK